MDTAQLSSRRAILSAGLAAIAGAAAATLGRSEPARANTGDPLVLGHTDNTTDQATSLAVTGSSAVAFEVVAYEPGDRSAIRGQGASGGAGVTGYAPSGFGVSGGSTLGHGVYGVSTGGDGVVGEVTSPGTGAAIRGKAPKGRGASLSGGKAALRLVPSTTSTHPASGAAGDLFVDKSKRLWFCKGGRTWKLIA